MKKIILSIVTIVAISNFASAQKVKNSEVPAAVKSALVKKYPEAVKVTWEKEKGNFEANWGGKSGEDTAVQFSPDGSFIEEVLAMPVSDLPLSITDYVKEHYKGVKITEAGKVTNAKGIKMFEAEIKGKDLIFDEKGNFLKKD